jgi:hypothetical protein
MVSVCGHTHGKDLRPGTAGHQHPERNHLWAFKVTVSHGCDCCTFEKNEKW